MYACARAEVLRSVVCPLRTTAALALLAFAACEATSTGVAASPEYSPSRSAYATPAPPAEPVLPMGPAEPARYPAPTPAPADPTLIAIEASPPSAPATSADAGSRDEGEVDAHAIAGAIRARIPSIRECYERELRVRADLRVRVDVRFTLETRGTATPTGCAATVTGHDALCACVSGVIASIAYPAPRGGPVDFSFPFNFTPGD